MHRYLKFAIFLVIIAGLITGFIYLRKLYIIAKTDQKSAVEMLSNETMSILCINDMTSFNKYLENNPQIAELITNENADKINNVLSNFLRIGKIMSNKIWFAFYNTGSGTETVFCVEANPFVVLVAKRYYNKHKEDFRFGDKDLYVDFSQGIIVGSENKKLLDQALQMPENTNLSDDKDFCRISDAKNADAVANFYLNLPIFTGYLMSKNVHSRDVLHSLLSFSKWLEYDIVEDNSNYIYSGFASSPKSEGFLAYQIAEKAPLHSSLTNNLPERTSFFINYHFDDFSDIMQGDFAQYFSDWISKDMSYFVFRDFSGVNAEALALKFNDFETTKTSLDRLLYVYGDNREVVSTDLIHHIEVPEDFSNCIYTFFPKNKDIYFSRIGDAVYFSTSSVYIRTLRILFDRNEFIKDDDFFNNNSQASNLDLYINDVSYYIKNAPKLSLKVQFSGQNGALLYSTVSVE